MHAHNDTVDTSLVNLPFEQRAHAQRRSRRSSNGSGKLVVVSQTSGPVRLLVFRLDGQRYALPIGAVERVVRAAEITPLPNAPSVVRGAIDVHGRLLPVVDLRRRLRLPERGILPADSFVLANTPHQTVVLVTDDAEGIIERDTSEIVPADRIVPGLEYVSGLTRLPDGLVLIQDLNRLLSLDEANTVARAIDDARGR